MKYQAICQLCGKTYDMGYNGTIDGCDDCLGVQRDMRGHVWHPDDTHHVYVNFDGSLDRVVMRPVDLHKSRR